MKICTKCKKEKASDEFYNNSIYKDRLTYFCKECYKSNKTEAHRQADKEYQRKRRTENPEWKVEQTRKYQKRYPERVCCNVKLNCAVKAGKIKKQPCEICGKENSQGHHEDYSKPLEVIWLCPSCHKGRHNGRC